MRAFDRGVDFYTTGQVVFDVNFPENETVCKWCTFCRKDNDIRYRCFLTNRIIYSTELRHPDCPIEFNKKQEDTKE